MGRPVAAMTTKPLGAAQSVGGIMAEVILAALPGAALFTVFCGWGVVLNVSIAVLAALVFEAAMLHLRDRPVRPFVLDGSAVVTALLLALALPPLAPWWLPVTGAFFAIVMAKHLYGGLGYNAFNPAMAAYAVLLVSFPREMTAWVGPWEAFGAPMELAQTARWVFTGALPAGLDYDALSSATVLDRLRTELGLERTMQAIRAQPVYGVIGAARMEWINLTFLAGGLWLLYRRIITWHVPVGLLGGLLLVSLLFYGIDPQRYADPLFHLATGASIVGAFFIATDPVTAAATPRGRLIYGAGIGALTYAIRTWGGYPDGIAFAVLLVGMAVPMIDRYTQPRVYGQVPFGRHE